MVFEADHDRIRAALGRLVQDDVCLLSRLQQFGFQPRCPSATMSASIGSDRGTSMT
jgi:hypothetical protein